MLDEQISQKSKAELRAQRRALQEAQRAAKQARKSGNQESSQSLQTHNKSNEQLSTPQARTGVNVAKDSDCINVNNEMSVCENDSKISGHLVTNQLKTQGIKTVVVVLFICLMYIGSLVS